MIEMFDPRYMVKQYIGRVKGPETGISWNVYATGNPKWVLLRQLDPTNTWETGIEVPVERTNMKMRLPR